MKTYYKICRVQNKKLYSAVELDCRVRYIRNKWTFPHGNNDYPWLYVFGTKQDALWWYDLWSNRFGQMALYECKIKDNLFNDACYIKTSAVKLTKKLKVVDIPNN